MGQAGPLHPTAISGRAQSLLPSLLYHYCILLYDSRAVTQLEKYAMPSLTSGGTCMQSR